ncbi:MAG: hypothetical protein B6U97_02490, partial [Candidatus Altiarchaeales archaeon ex4484_96]
KRLGQKGVRVIIARAPCVILKGADVGEPLVVKDCSGCKKCLNLGCPAISFNEETNSVEISPLCTGCGVCAIVCPSNAIVKK